ncbi:hypothetical protein D3C83_161320 [compost metagenome]
MAIAEKPTAISMAPTWASLNAHWPRTWLLMPLTTSAATMATQVPKMRGDSRLSGTWLLRSLWRA